MNLGRYRNSVNGTVVEKLEILNQELLIWAKTKKAQWNGAKWDLFNKVHDLMEQDRDDDNLVDLIGAKIQLNWEIDKDEIFWEQYARAN